MSSTSFVVAESATERLVCKTNGFNYTPDLVRHKYGAGQRRPLEEWFLDELDFFQKS